MATPDPIADIIGDYRAFAGMQRDRLVAHGIDIAPYPLSHLTVRVADWDLFVHQRTLLEHLGLVVALPYSTRRKERLTGRSLRLAPPHQSWCT